MEISMGNLKDKLDIAIKLGALVALLLIALSNIYIFYYYNQFGIDIYGYLKPTDLIPLFLPICFKIAFIGIPSIAIPLASFLRIYTHLLRRKKRSKFRMVKYKHDILKKFTLITSLICISGIVITLILDQHKNPTTHSQNEIGLTRNILFVLLMTLTLNYGFHFYDPRYIIYRRLPHATLIFSLFVSLILTVCKYNVNEVKFHRYNSTLETTKLVFKDTTLFTNDSTKLIGSPGETLIFFHTGSKKTKVYNKSDLVAPIEIQMQ
ncbi:hypothetical protein ACQ86N_42285 [Puia sp. P3]|uniref:hypothetical protein n=1 Tax=Puia sp. P3 TaxID=3423952 RepID=UPI003D67E248